jgi:hypothetical protein
VCEKVDGTCTAEAYSADNRAFIRYVSTRVPQNRVTCSNIVPVRVAVTLCVGGGEGGRAQESNPIPYGKIDGLEI